MTAERIREKLLSLRNYDKSIFLQRFFKTGEGEYAEGDLFLGITVPHQREVAKTFAKTPLHELELLLHDKYHECRLTALIILTERTKKSKDEEEKRAIFELYLRNTAYINNWDLVDVTANYVVGRYLMHKDRSVLYRLAESPLLWEQRIAMIATLEFIRNHDFADTLLIAEKLVYHQHDLMHKAVGWMLREAGKRNVSVLIGFLDQYAATMPRTMLRYAIEKLDEETRQYYLGRKKELAEQ